MSQQIAFFDFDGTITSKDTLLEFIKFYKGKLSFYKGFILNSPFIIAYKLKIIPNQKAKEKILRFFFRNEPLDTFQMKCEEFIETKLPDLIRPKALQQILEYNSRNIPVVIVTASAGNWISTWSSNLGVQLIASKLEIIDKKITGNLDGKNCHGHEKVKRIKELFELVSYKMIHVYGDSSGDKAMLEIGHKKYYKPFLIF